MQKVTINVVAKHAGVSKKTVSRVLNNEPNVSDATKQKVRAVFDELGYRPSPVARALATNQSFLIGLVYDNPNKSYVSEIQEGALSSCDDKGYHLIIHPTDHNGEHLLSNIDSLLTESRLDGLVLTPPFSDMPHLISLLDNRGTPYVRIGATEFCNVAEQNRVLSVISNDQQAAYQMTKYLISLGHHKIGFVKGHPDHPVSEQRYNGFVTALEDAGISLEQGYVQQGYFNFSSGEDCGRRLLSLDERPTAIFASNDYMAAGILKVASQCNISVPHELSVAGFDNAPISEYIWPSLTTVRQPIFAMAESALDILVDRIQKRPAPEKVTELSSELVTRESTAPLR